MRPAAWLIVLLVACGVAVKGDEKAIRFKSKAEVVSLAREALSKILPLDKDVTISVVKKPHEPIGTWRLRFETKIPEGFFAGTDFPEVTVHSVTGETHCNVWSDDADGADLPNPQMIAQRFLMGTRGRTKEPERAIRLMLKWMDANRKNPDYSSGHDFAYARLARAFRESDQPERLEAALKREISEDPCPWAEYAARHELAKLYTETGQYDQAIEHMRFARQAVKDGKTSILRTRHALGLFEMGKIYAVAGQNQKAATCFEEYLETQKGKQNCFEPGKLLGAIYESDQEWAKAEALYEKIIATQFRRESPSIIRYKDDFRKLLSSLAKRKEDLEKSEAVAEEVTNLITELGSNDASLRKAAADRLLEIGPAARIHLEKYRDDPDPEVRLTVRELLKNL